MARKERKTLKPSLTIEELISQSSDVDNFYAPAMFKSKQMYVDELSFTVVPPHPFDPERFARDLDLYGSRVSVVADSNIFLAPTDQRIWDALLRNKQLRMISPVVAEIEPWIKDPRGTNVGVHRDLRDACDGKTDAIRFFDVPVEYPHIIHAVEWYANLLGTRKLLRKIVGPEEVGKPAVEQKNYHVNNVIRKTFGGRSERLAISGDKSKVINHRFHDEAIVMMTILHALVARQHTVLLTRDEDVLEQFRKACWLIDTHYRAMRVAEIYSADAFAFGPVRRYRDVSQSAQDALRRGFADDNVVLLRKPSDHMREVLPQERQTISVQCCRIRNLCEILMFGAIDGFRSLFRVKGENHGRNTDKFEDKNCHISLGPLMRDVGNWAAIGRDRTVKRGRFDYSMIDVNLVINEREGAIRLRPTNVVVP